MDLLTAELNRKRKEASSAFGSGSAAGGGGAGGGAGTGSKKKKKKYVKRGDAARAEKRQQDEALESKRRALNGQASAGAGGGATGEGGGDGGGGCGGGGVAVKAAKAEAAAAAASALAVEAAVTLSYAEVARRLRAMGEVVTYFGERAAQRFARMRERERNFRGGSELKLGRGYDGHQHGGEDDAGGGDGAAEGGGAVVSDDGAADGGNSDDDDGVVGGGGSDGGGASGEGVGAAAAADGPPLTAEDRAQLEGCALVYRWCKETMRTWSEQLAARAEDERRSAAGKMLTQTHKQCKDYIRPLFRMCRDGSLNPSIRLGLGKIIRWCEQGEFSKAHDQYLLLAIGNAAWPIGVTMVGIHARGGREKISSSKVAHVMNDEQQRKYLTSVKRLMTFAQNDNKSIAPSKKCM